MAGSVDHSITDYNSCLWHLTLLPGLGPLFLCGLGASWAPELVLAGLCDAPFTAAAAAAASAAAFNKAIVWDLGRRPRTPLRTGSGGKGLGSRYEVCMEEEELEEERRVLSEAEVEETGARSAPGRVTRKIGWKEKKRQKQTSFLFYLQSTFKIVLH